MQKYHAQSCCTGNRNRLSINLVTERHDVTKPKQNLCPRSGIAGGDLLLGMQNHQAKSRGFFGPENESGTFFRNGVNMPLSFQKVGV